MNSFAANLPNSKEGISTLEIVGERMFKIGSSLKPTSPISCGIFNPFCLIANIAPMAKRSLIVKIASGFFFMLSNS